MLIQKKGGEKVSKNNQSNLSENKVTALKNSIVQECRNQGFTLSEYIRLVDSLRFVYEERKKELYKNSKL